MLTRIVQGLTALLAVALVSSPAMASPTAVSASSDVASASSPANPATTTRKIALGVSMVPAANPNAYADFTASVGRAPAVWSVWANWADSSSAFPTALVDQLHAGRTVPFIFWQLAGTNTAPDGSGPLQRSCGTDYKSIINGHWDQYIHAWAHDAIGHGTILIRFAHEMDGRGAFPWGVSRCKNTPAKFILMWRHVVQIFRDEHASNVKFVWSPIKAISSRKSLYPGSSWVDYVGFTAFNWAASKDRPWLTLAQQVQTATDGVKTYAGDKPWIVAEAGTVEQAGNSRHSWLTKGYNKVYTQFPKIKVIVYFNIDMTVLEEGQPDWTLHPGADINAYTLLLQKPQFQGVIKQL